VKRNPLVGWVCGDGLKRSEKRIKGGQEQSLKKRERGHKRFKQEYLPGRNVQWRRRWTGSQQKKPLGGVGGGGCGFAIGAIGAKEGARPQTTITLMSESTGKIREW